MITLLGGNVILDTIPNMWLMMVNGGEIMTTTINYVHSGRKDEHDRRVEKMPKSGFQHNITKIEQPW
jgi:hypothetical protein